MKIVTKYRELDCFKVDNDSCYPDWIDDYIDQGNLIINTDNFYIFTERCWLEYNTGDYIIKDEQGNLFPCSQARFEMDYDVKVIN